jgi:hypothetical protein
MDKPTQTLRAEREARKAAQAARVAEMHRICRNDEARRRRAEKKAAALREQKLSKLIGVLGLLGSDQAGERASAALHAERIRLKLGKSWRELLSLGSNGWGR